MELFVRECSHSARLRRSQTRRWEARADCCVLHLQRSHRTVGGTGIFCRTSSSEISYQSSFFLCWFGWGEGVS
ncbi:hypothetical protein DL95DRAFT_395467 [Leptodontidium sp. 2 PMI_412]|nr:hypothetical protein DL95DRAFT_395467 [Leptodontidium sp. 2 PMI_412]